MSDEPRDLMAALRASVDLARTERELKQAAITARARGDWEAERHALDGLILLERGRLGSTEDPPTTEETR